MSKMMSNNKPLSFRCIDFKTSTYKDNDFFIRMYGIDENRNTYCVHVNDFKPFFYIKVGNDWDEDGMDRFMAHLKKTSKQTNFALYKSLCEDIDSVELISRKTLYHFDNHQEHAFLYFKCHNMNPLYKIKPLYYDREKQKLFPQGYVFEDTKTELYETMIPPMLRFFHLQNISPSGWVSIEKYTKLPKTQRNSNTTYEIGTHFENIQSDEEKETIVPYKICSFDIEASSSHGDFPTAKKDYKKVAYDTIEYMEKNMDAIQDYGYETTLKQFLLCVFQFGNDLNVDHCFVKNKDYSVKMFHLQFLKLLKYKVDLCDEQIKYLEHSMDSYFQTKEDEGDEVLDTTLEMNGQDEGYDTKTSKPKPSSKKTKENMVTLIDVLKDESYDAKIKTSYLLQGLNNHLPPLEGDYVTFIGSTFVTYGENESSLNHCICLGNTTNLEKKNQVIECYEDEKEVLLAWTKLIQTEDPDIIIGYNIFGFDYPFMFDRADEHDCVQEFLAFSRYDDGEETEELEETSIILASGAYELKYPPMEGRLQIDVFTYMRKEFILPSYKLDYVSSYLISDKVKSFCNYVEEDDETAESCKIETKNMKGITLNCYVHFEIINHSNDLYENGKKFKVIELEDDGFIIEGHLSDELENETMQWGLAKDDVTPQDIFRMTNEGPNEKGIIAKYCIQDCNLVHQIFQKIDIMTTYIEMSKICSVPISFLMMRGQGIKLTSYIAKKCREMNTLMPLISKGNQWDMYEGAIVLEPKTNLYLDNPVACVDYSSLYPSSIISENISHDSKVWTKTYNLDHEMLYETGEKDKSGQYIYDNLPEYKYVDIQYDTFAFKRSSASAAAKKVLTGYKVCRYAQFPNGERAIMPAILQELLAARTATKKQMKKETDPFMKNILDKRQLSIKVTANSLYGQTGAKTSTFYEMDVAASTTATGRKLLHYARDIIENVYNNLKVDTCYGAMITNAEYIYGDTDSVFFTFNLKDEQGKEVRGQKALEGTIELAKEAGELATTFLKDPHDLEYEKTFMPFCLLSKKRYVGMLYEEDPHKCKRKSMGIVLKRRDNAPIVKDVYGGIIDILMKQQNIQQSISFLDQMLNDIVNQNIPIHKLIISKSLRSFYKNPKQIAHKVLSDRMGVRDPGNKPSPGDRIPYVYILTSKKKDLQGNKIEHPDYIREKKLKIDYGFYITNQIMKPVLQIYSLVLYDMPQFQKRKKMFQRKIARMREEAEDMDKYHKKVQQMKDKEAEVILFEKYLILNKNKANNNSMITTFFQPT